MDVATESERKYQTPKKFTFPDLAGLAKKAGITQCGDVATHELDATYFDTEDLRLARNRITLRRRSGGTDEGWHLKTPGGGDDRTEHRLPLTDDEQVPDELLALVRAVVRDRPLRPVARLRTRRREYPLQDETGRVLALLADDRVHADAFDQQQNWREVEVELVEGDRPVLKALDKRLRAAGAAPATGPSKLARALGDRLSQRPPAAGADGKQPRAVRAVVAYVREQRDAIIANDAAVRRGDPAAVHAMRVATRRLRSTFRTFRGGLWERERTEALRGELSWLADKLGGVRDRQVMAARLHKAVAAEPPEVVVGPVDERIAEQLDSDLQDGRQELDRALGEARYFALLDELDRLVDDPPATGVRGRWVRRKAVGPLRRADDLLDQATAPAGAAQEADPEAASDREHDRNEHLHDARKAYKQARYAVEVFVPLEGAPARQLVKRLVALQDVLGDHQDSVITGELLREYADRAHTAGESAFTYGVLYARQQAAGEAVLARLPETRHAAASRKLRSWLR
ncbi:MAG TPA: CYTH and CHAD domain-containing protein [Micromonosporaceae bacterium]|nr:CYTH and CHAD domain-containing protein [Micromonosporaceae bacterium]